MKKFILDVLGWVVVAVVALTVMSGIAGVVYLFGSLAIKDPLLTAIFVGIFVGVFAIIGVINWAFERIFP